MICTTCGAELDCVLRCYRTVIVDRAFPGGVVQSYTQRDEGSCWYECESCGAYIPDEKAEEFVGAQ